MCLYWGVIPIVDIPTTSGDETVAAVTAWAVEQGLVRSRDYLVLVSGFGLTSGSHNQVMVHRVP